MSHLKLAYKPIVILALVALFFYSCDEDLLVEKQVLHRENINSDFSSKCKLISFSTTNMFFEELKIAPFVFNPNFDNRIHLNYLNARISQIQGGIVRSMPGGTENSYYWTNNVSTNLVYSSDTITVNNNGFYLKKFILSGNRIKKQITSYNPSLSFAEVVNYSPGLHEYQYNGNLITETKEGFVYRLFYLEQGNLVKVELFFRDVTGTIFRKMEYLFSDYDQHPNLLKGKFYIHGNFFKAFSNNNYRKLEIKTYNYINNSYQLDASQNVTFTYNFPADMYAQECN